jgi:hypothetical protein
MQYRALSGLLALAAVLCMMTSGVSAFDESKFPDWKGRWERTDPPTWIRGNQKAPLTPEYQKLFDAQLAEQKAGGFGLEVQWRCLPPGMPRIMNVYEAMELVITPAVTHMLISHIHDNRRIYTDGRPWPTDLEPTFKGYSIGQWRHSDGDGRYDMLEIETRGPFKGPRAYQANGLPLHVDNQTVIKEKIFLDKDDAMTLRDEITTIDHALTGPWTITKSFRRLAEARPDWHQEVCAENNPHVYIQGDNYYVGADGFLMPSKKDQPAPDLRYFRQSQR